MLKIYNEFKKIINDEMGKIDSNDALASFTAIYMPLAEKLSKKELSKEEYEFLAFLLLYYVSEIRGYKDEVEELLKLNLKDMYKVDHDNLFKEGVSLILNKNDIAGGMEYIYPKLLSIKKDRLK